jgi:hypothetical protein
MAIANNSPKRRVMSELSVSELAAVTGGIATTKPMEEGIYIDGVYVQTSAWSVYAAITSGAIQKVEVRGM